MTTNNTATGTLRDSAAARWTALLLLAMAMFFAYIFMDILSPIKDLMESTRGWDSTAFGTYAGSETFLNVFIFFLIIRNYPRQDGCALYSHTFRTRYAHRSLYQLVRRNRIVHGVFARTLVFG